MSTAAKRRRLVTAVAASITALAMLAGCGGSRVASSDTANQTGSSTGSTSDTSASTPTGGGAPTGTESTSAGTSAGNAASTTTAATGGGAATTTTTANAPAGGGSAAAVNAPAAAANVAAGSKGATAGGVVKAAAKKGKGAPAAPASKSGAAVTTSDSGLSGAAAAIAATVKSQQIFGGNTPCKAATGTPVNIGNVSTLSGVLGQLFAPVVPSLKTFVAAQNACGGLNGHPIKLFVEDDQDDPSTAVSKINDEIKNDHVLAFVGNIQVLTDDAIVTTIKRAGVPVIGSDITNNTWYTSPLLFPQGPGGEAIGYGYTVAAKDYFHKQKVGDVWCLEVPQACAQIDASLKEIGPKVGVDVVKTTQVSITSPSYTTQCLDFKNAGVEVLAMTFDAASQNRLVKSCDQVGYKPNYTAYPLGVGNQVQFFGNPSLGNTYVPLNTFPWMASDTPAEKYYLASVKKYNPGFITGDAASLGWTAGALLVAASTNLSANPTTAELLNNLYTFKGQSFTTLGGLTPAPLSYSATGNPKIPYCLFSAVSNKANTDWGTSDSTAKCTDIIASNDPQKH
ncbi:MAG TPA: ABC transporter substrate-binding protein [Pseudonocardiaceae bacterium]|nr:ABC transporter substrate-binding protein [Pseudonocardiaceae bacterium]